MLDCGERKVGRGRLRVKGDGWGKVRKAGKEGLVVTVEEEQDDEEKEAEQDQEGDDDGDGCVVCRC